MASFILELKNIRLGRAITHERNRPIRNTSPSNSESDFRGPELCQLAHSSWDPNRIINAGRRLHFSISRGPLASLRPNGFQLAHFRRPIWELDIAEPTVRNPPNLTAENCTVELTGGHLGDKKRDKWGCRKAVNRR
jgi:hypothetical protein